MRPAVGASDEPARARKPSVSDAMPSSLGANAPTSFMLASELDLEQRETDAGPTHDSTYGIRSIDDAEESAADERELDATNTAKSGRRPPMLRTPENLSRAVSNASLGASKSRAVASHQQTETISQPLTPVSFASHAFESSVPSSPKSLSMRSFRQSDDDFDGSGSQAIASSEDEGEAALKAPLSPPQQLIMPSLIMPSRRPFTDKGRSIGKLRIMVAGRSRVGKTTLIKSMIQTCEDIVHVDTSSLQSLQTRRSPARPAKGFPTPRALNHITEIYASTKAHPNWWTESGGSDLLQRQRSMDESVLARNLCFIDTPGYDRGTSNLEGMELTLQYMEKQMRKPLAPHELNDSELLSMLSGHGSSQVDVVLYLLDHELRPSDLEFIRQLNTLSCIIPLLAKADMLDDTKIADLKCSTIATLSGASIPLITLPSSKPDEPTLPFTVCSSPSNELDAMDASVLMQSEYIPQLRSSDLYYLLNTLFDPINIAYLKHAAACKLVSWRASPHRTQNIPSPILTSMSSAGQSSTPSQSTFVPITRPSSLRLPPPPSSLPPAGGIDPAQESRAANLRLAAWASSLQRNLAHERQRYEALARGERVAWLRAQLDAYDGLEVPDLGREKMNKGALLHLPHKGDALSSPRHMHKHRHAADDLAGSDPLGLVRLRTRAMRSGRFALQVAGGMGVLGAAMFWVLQRSGHLEAVCDWWMALGTVGGADGGGGSSSSGGGSSSSGLLERLWAWISSSYY